MKRYMITLMLLASLSYLGYQAITHKMGTPEGLSFETLFRIAGQPVKTFDRSITKAIGVNVKNEQELGNYLATQLVLRQVAGYEVEKKYVNSVIQELANQYNPKKLHYHVFIMDGQPNAFAMAGGNIVITTGMLSMLKSEAELVAILGHEKGHIDLGHCIDQLRIQAKTYHSNLGAFIDWYFRQLFTNTFSKFQENESDRYGFESLIALKYDPQALGDSFQKMSEKFPQAVSRGYDPIGSYLASHPSLAIRAENWKEKAHRWKLQNPQKPYYVGKENFEKKESRINKEFQGEWHIGFEHK